MKKILSFFVVLSLLFMASCGSSKVNELKQSFSEKVSEKVKEASIHSLGCSTGDAVYSDVKKQLDKSLKVEDNSSHKSVLLVQLCEQGVKLAFPHLVDLGTGKLPDSWVSDGCSLSSVGEDVEKLAFEVCGKLK